MGLLLLIPFFILLAIFFIDSKSDLYAHEHDSSIREELHNFETNFKQIEILDLETNYSIGNNHIYNN